MYRRGGFRDDLLAERAAAIVGIDARLAEIDELLHAPRACVPRCECGAPLLRGSHFCPNCGRPSARRPAASVVGGDGHRAGRARRCPRDSDERRSAIAAADGTCPRCGAVARARPASTASSAGSRFPPSPGRSPRLRRALDPPRRLVPGRLGLDLAADARRRGRRRRGRDRLTTQQASGAGPVFTATTRCP